MKVFTPVCALLAAVAACLFVWIIALQVSP